MIIFFDIILGFSIISILSILAYFLKYLDRDGAIVGIMIGSIILVGGGWSALIIMMVFFIISVFSTRLKYSYKRHLGFGQEKGGKRGWKNTVANGSVASVSVLAGFYFSEDIFYAAFLGAMATSMADTLATEIGLLSKSRPRLITNLRKKVGAGTSGGISILGELILILGSLSIGVLAFLFKFSEISFVGLILITVSGGIVGSHIDSILGATIQSMNRCVVCGFITENN
ncbi:TIGR00297 family protein, partial [Thermoproteota archaeon]